MSQPPAVEMPGISVVVPVYQGEGLIEQCIQSLLQLDYPAELLEILVVDNASTDRTAQVVRSFDVRLLSEPRQGASIACNTGWREARFPFIAFTDADCVVDPQWLKCLLSRMDDETVGGVGGKLAAAPAQNLIQQYIVRKNILSQERAMEEHPGSPPFVVTANVLYRREALEKVGGLDESLTGAGYDADLAWRIQWAGYKIVYEPQAIVWHHHRATLRSFMRQLRGYGSGESQLFAKHRERFGRSRYFNSQPYRQMAKAVVKTPLAALAGKSRLDRMMPLLEFLDSFSYLRGKIGMSLKQRVWYF